MAMRLRGGGASAPPRRGGGRMVGGVRRVYEDFTPMSEWEQDDQSHILNIFLPGFMKEQIKVSTEGHNTIRVRGERLVAGNKWSRFQEDFQVPENGEMNSVRAKYQGGILNITVPKKNVEKPQEPLPPISNQPKSTDVQKQATPQKGQNQNNSEASTSQPKDEKTLEPQKVLGNQKQPTPQKGKDFQAVDNSQSINEKPLEPKRTSDDQKQPTPKEGKDKDIHASTNEERLEPQKEHHQRERGTTPLSTVISPDAEKKDSESKGKHIAAKGKEVPEIETAKRTKQEREGAIGMPEKKGDNNGLYGALTKKKYKKAVKGLAELNEERQLMVNMGAAMLVIVALTAYATYKFASVKDRN